MAAMEPSPRSPGSRQSWEQETLALIDEMQKDRLKVEQRRVTAERQIADLDTDIAALRRAIDRYRASRGQAKAPLIVTETEAAPYKGQTAKEMILTWADAHDGTIAVKEASQFFAAAELFKDAEQAASSLYPTIKRMLEAAELKKAARGVYQRVSAPLRVVPPRRGRLVISDGPSEEDAFGGELDGQIDLDDAPF